MGVWTIVTGFLGFSANSLAIIVFVKSPKVFKNYILKTFSSSFSAENTFQLSPDESLDDRADHLSHWTSFPRIQLLCWRVELRSNSLQTQRSLHDLPRFHQLYKARLMLRFALLA